MPLYHDTPPPPAQQSTSTTSSGGGTQSKAVPAALTTAGESGKKDTMNATKGLTAAFFDGMKKRLLESIDEEMHGDISSMDSVTVVNEMRVVFQTVRALHQSKWFPKIYQKTEPLFTAIDKFSGVIDNAVQLVSFSAAGPIWGIIKWSFKFVESEATLYIQLIEDLERFDKDLCLAHDLSTIGQLSEALAEAIKDVYAAIIDYWLFVPKLYTQKKRILGTFYSYPTTFFLDSYAFRDPTRRAYH
ncbi:hypothetical protein FRC17_008926 [Serendipita sp. 399]|nr:hypothetical protein FRC17_008926 [Serendipita sp. 399]